MGLSVLPAMSEIIMARKAISELYDRLLNFQTLQRPVFYKNQDYNYAYYPVIFPTEETLLKVKDSLFSNGISCRRYFYPSLNKLPFLLSKKACPVSEDISRRVLALPLYHGLETSDIHRISEKINNNI